MADLLPDQSRPHREHECPIDGCFVCMPPVAVAIDPGELAALRAETEALAKFVALAADAYDGTFKIEHADRDAMRALVGGRGLLFDERSAASDDSEMPNV